MPCIQNGTSLWLKICPPTFRYPRCNPPGEQALLVCCCTRLTHRNIVLFMVCGCWQDIQRPKTQLSGRQRLSVHSSLAHAYSRTSRWREGMSNLADGPVEKFILEAGVALAAQAVHQAVLHLLQHAHPAHPLPAVPYPPCNKAQARLQQTDCTPGLVNHACYSILHHAIPPNMVAWAQQRATVGPMESGAEASGLGLCFPLKFFSHSTDAILQQQACVA